MALATKSKKDIASAVASEEATTGKKVGPSIAPAKETLTTQDTEVPLPLSKVALSLVPNIEVGPTPTMEKQFAKMQALMMEFGKEVKNMKASRRRITTRAM